MSIEVMDGFGVPDADLVVDSNVVSIAERAIAQRRRVVFISKLQGGNEQAPEAMEVAAQVAMRLRLHGHVTLHTTSNKGEHIETYLEELVYDAVQEEQSAFLHVRSARYKRHPVIESEG